MLNKSYDGIIFDLDGTMWDTRKPICEAWNIILSRHEEIHRAPIVEADLNDCMGLPMYDIAAKLFPQEQELRWNLSRGFSAKHNVSENSVQNICRAVSPQRMRIIGSMVFFYL